MEYRVGDRQYGFIVERVRHSEELAGNMVEMRHEKTGAQLVWIQNGSDNKLFCVGFCTPPENSTGVFHILEHSVLCGSKKYPVREPFVELMKSSMNTFLNAMTYSDKTIYPVSSRNDQDFLNLTEVYLDAVYAPRLTEDPNIFYQEGWHLERDEKGEYCYKGVVFNEMKGATGDPDEIIVEKLMEMLYPDNCYRYNSGGDPTVIPQLSYQQFEETYRRHYNASNSRIFLDGDVPMDRTLPLIASYLDAYEAETDLPTVSPQTPVAREDEVTFEIAAEEDPSGKSRLAVGKILCGWRDRVTLLAAQALCNYLTDNNDSPLTRAILSAGLGESLGCYIDSSIAQPFIGIDVKNIPDGKIGDVLPLLRKTVSELLADGLDKQAIEACVNRMEFRMREPDEPQALDRCDLAYRSWLYGGDPMLYLVMNDDFAALREWLAGDEFEKLAKKIFLDDEGLCVLRALPSKERGEKLRREENERIAATVGSWREEEKNAQDERVKALLLWQKTEDTPENIATLPVLDLKEIPAKYLSHTPTVFTEKEGVRLLTHTIPTSGVIHFTLYFDLTDFSEKELTVLSMVSGFFGQLPTEKYTLPELQQLLNRYVGRFHTGFGVHAPAERNDVCTPTFRVYCSTLAEHYEKALGLMEEILFHTDFNAADKMKELLLQEDEDCKQYGVTSGNRVAVMNVLSHYSAAGAVNDALNGYPFVAWIHSLVKDLDRFLPDCVRLWRSIPEKVLCKKRMTLSVTAGSEVDTDRLIALFPEGSAAPQTASYSSDMPKYTAFRIPAQIGFSAVGGLDERRALHGSMNVAANILSLSYLWNVVRVQGGAYGTGMNIGRRAIPYTSSYRDPTPLRSVQINEQLASHLLRFCDSGESLDKYIISTIGGLEPLRSPRDRGIAADTEWFNGYTEERLSRERAEILATTRDDLRRLEPMLNDFAQNGARCVVGYDALLRDAEGYTVFDL